jgi:dihydrofolate reductase
MNRRPVAGCQGRAGPVREHGLRHGPAVDLSWTSGVRVGQELGGGVHLAPRDRPRAGDWHDDRRRAIGSGLWPLRPPGHVLALIERSQAGQARLPELQEASWENARVVGDLEAACAALKAVPGRGILALSSGSVVQAQPHADLVDDLRFTVVPRDRPWRATAPARRAAGSRWELAETTTFAQDAVGFHCRRARDVTDAEAVRDAAPAVLSPPGRRADTEAMTTWVTPDTASG